MSNFSLYWEIDNVVGNIDFSTRRNIKKRVLFPRYQGSVGEEDCILGYIGSKDITPDSNLDIIKLEDSIVENSSSSFSGDQAWVGKTGYSNNRYFLLTDITASHVSKEIAPFYWKHQLPVASISPDSIVILDKNLKEVNSETYYALRTEARDSSDNIVSGSYESCCVFSNYKNEYNKDTSKYNVYYVRYEVNGTKHYELLNPTPAFSEATIDDVSSITGQLKTWRKVYIVSTIGSSFTITTPQSGETYYLTPLEKSRIVVREPTDRDDQLPWFLNVSNGSFSIIRNSKNFIYSIPEFSNQTFSPLYPYKIEVEEKGELLEGDLIKVDRSQIQVSTSSLYPIEILIKDLQDRVLYALTTDSNKNGTYYTENDEPVLRTIETDNAWVLWDSETIIGWDQQDGFIHLNKDFPSNYYFYITYYYEETGYELSSLNVNPIFDEDYDSQFYVIYIIPVGGDNNNTSQTSSLHYVKVDRSGRIVETSQDNSGGNIDLSSTIHIGSQYMYYSKYTSTTTDGATSVGQNYITLTSTTNFPSAGILKWTDVAGITNYFSYDRISGNTIYFETQTILNSVLSGTTVELHSFLNPYTTAGTNDYQWLVLAECHSSPSSKINNLSIIDLRKRGGVIKEKYFDAALEKDPRSVWALPSVITGKGQLTPGNSVAIVKIPYTLLTDYGGTFTLKEIEAVVRERHLAVGILPVILLHGAIPNISSISSSSNSVTVCWDSEGSDYGYYIYYSTQRNGPWTKANSSAFSDQIYGNCYTINNLTSNNIYYITITSVNSDNIESPKSDIWGIRTKSS